MLVLKCEIWHWSKSIQVMINWQFSYTVWLAYCWEIFKYMWQEKSFLIPFRDDFDPVIEETLLVSMHVTYWYHEYNCLSSCGSVSSCSNATSLVKYKILNVKWELSKCKNVKSKISCFKDHEIEKQEREKLEVEV